MMIEARTHKEVENYKKTQNKDNIIAQYQGLYNIEKRHDLCIKFRDKIIPNEFKYSDSYYKRYRNYVNNI